MLPDVAEEKDRLDMLRERLREDLQSQLRDAEQRVKQLLDSGKDKDRKQKEGWCRGLRGRLLDLLAETEGELMEVYCEEIEEELHLCKQLKKETRTKYGRSRRCFLSRDKALVKERSTTH